jgi:cytochrome c peroxidase
MSTEDQTAVNRAYVNFGKSIAAFERTLTVQPTRFDAYVAGVLGKGPYVSLSSDEIAGLRLFMGKGQCANCHNGPMLSNHGFANTGVPARPDLPADVGRSAGVRAALADPFNCKGAYSDAPKACDELEFAVVGSHEQVRAYKVPSLRGAAQRAPYMHAGQFASLEEVIDHYSRAPQAPDGESEIRPANFTLKERRQIVAFLHTLDDGRAPHEQ